METTDNLTESDIEPIDTVIIPTKYNKEVQTDRRHVSQKQLDALARGRELNLQRRRAYIEFEKMQHVMKIHVEPVQKVEHKERVYKLSFV